MTSVETAEYLGICRKTLLTLVKQGLVPCFRPARHYRFRKSEIDEWMDSTVRVSTGRVD
ncbi:MAG: helix-turn-helix domain-containing protein [Patescibacteria group bacterium]